MPRRLIVLDTNVVLDLLHFDDPLSRPLRCALESGTVRGAASEATFDEWPRVLAYPAFRLPADRQIGLCAAYRSWCEFFVPPPVSRVPPCRDRDDQKFLDLAAGLAIPLVSKDRAVLKLSRRRKPYPVIFTPAEALGWLTGCA